MNKNVYYMSSLEKKEEPLMSLNLKYLRWNEDGDMFAQDI